MWELENIANDTRKIVKPKDITDGIARMMVLELRLFDTIEGVGFNELFKLVPFTNPNSFEIPDFFETLGSFENPDKFETLDIFEYSSRSRKNFVFRPEPDISGSRTPLIIILYMNISNSNKSLVNWRLNDIFLTFQLVHNFSRGQYSMSSSPTLTKCRMKASSRWKLQEPSGTFGKARE